MQSLNDSGLSLTFEVELVICYPIMINVSRMINSLLISQIPSYPSAGCKLLIFPKILI